VLGWESLRTYVRIRRAGSVARDALTPSPSPAAAGEGGPVARDATYRGRFKIKSPRVPYGTGQCLGTSISMA